MLLRTILFAMFFALVGCQSGSNSGGDGGETPTYKPMSKAESKRLEAVFQSVGGINGIVKDKSGRSLKSLGRILGKKEAGDDSFGELSDEITPDNCEIIIPDIDDVKSSELSVRQGNSDFSIPTMTLEIKGEGCPIYLLFSIQGEQQGETGFSAQFNMKYEAKSDEFRGRNDVDRMNLVGDIFAEMKGANTNPPPKEVTINTKVALNGTIHSQKEGDVQVNYSANTSMTIPTDFGSQIGESSESSMRTCNTQTGEVCDISQNDSGMPKVRGTVTENTQVEMKGLSALLKAVMKFSEKGSEEKYYINGKEVTEKEYRKYMDELDFPGLDDDDSVGEGPTPQPNLGYESPMLCTMSIFRSEEISIDDMENTTPLWKFSACQDTDKGTSSFREVVDGVLVEGEIMFFKEMIQGRIRRVQSTPEMYTTFYALPGELTDDFRDADPYTLRFTCEETSFCP